jgi:hypothetical protein
VWSWVVKTGIGKATDHSSVHHHHQVNVCGKIPHHLLTYFNSTFNLPPLQFHSSIHIIYDDDDDDDDDAHAKTPNQKFLGPCMVKKKVFNAELQNHICTRKDKISTSFFFFFFVFPLWNEDK